MCALSVLTLMGCNQAVYEEKISEVSLLIRAPFSTSMVSFQEYSSGALISYKASYERAYGSDVTRKDVVWTITGSQSISLEEFDQLQKTIRDKGFRYFRPRYIQDSIQDGIYTTVIVKSFPSSDSLQEREYTVTCYELCPDPMGDIISAIKTLWWQDMLELGI